MQTAAQYVTSQDLSEWAFVSKPKNNDISISPKEGYVKGCGCLLEKKIPNEKKHCPAGKW